MPQPPLPVESVGILNDNHVWLFPTSATTLAAVDPGEAAPVTAWLEKTGRGLSHILITHHHADHTGGVAALKARHGAAVVGFQGDRHRLPPLDVAVAEGTRLQLGAVTATVLEVPGHTSGHVAYLVDGEALFAGDCLFSLGCGRLFEGTAAEMWHSLLKLRALPDSTRLFAAHEYTLANLEFVRTLEPDRPDLAALRQTLFALTDRQLPTLPSTLGREKRFNPFLRADDPLLQKRLGADGRPPAAVFADIRQRKDRF